MGFHKARHLIEQAADWHNLQMAADDALDALSDKHIWYAKLFEGRREERLKAIQQMILTGQYPAKEYKAVTITSEYKERDINPLHYDPWSIIFHAFKRVLDPIIQRVMIYDTSAGICGRGQHFAAVRTQELIRRYHFTHFSWSDYRKFYQSLLHDEIIDSLRWIIRDERFIEAIKTTILDYMSDVEPLLIEEDAKKRKNCDWASDEPLRLSGERGITIGNCLSQMLGNLVMCRLDHRVKEVYRLKGYHRHCDDKTMFHYSLEEAREFLRIYDAESNKMGLCMKASSYYAPLKDEKNDIDGRPLDFVGFVFSTENMRVRKRVKQKFARGMARVRSKKRKQELLAAYHGIFKWGRCKNLWNIITGYDMSFAQKGILTDKISYDERGRRIFNVPQFTINIVSSIGTVWFLDFEDDIEIRDKKDGTIKKGRCCVLYREDATKDNEKADKKFFTSSKLIIDKLRKAREREQQGEKMFPIDTKVFRVTTASGFPTWDIE